MRGSDRGRLVRAGGVSRSARARSARARFAGARVAGVGLAATVTLGWLGIPAAVAAQGSGVGRAGPRAVLDRDVETSLALSAAPARVSAGARVLLWDGDAFVVGREGTTGVTCYVGRSWPDSLEPHCFDEEGSRTVLPIHLHETVMWHRGHTREQIQSAVGEGLRDGTFTLPRRPAMSYMMSARQELIDDEGRPVGAWQPHLMIYFPYLTDASLGLGSPVSTEAALVVDPGTPLSNVMIVVPDFATETVGR